VDAGIETAILTNGFFGALLIYTYILAIPIAQELQKDTMRMIFLGNISRQQDQPYLVNVIQHAVLVLMAGVGKDAQLV
jgi:hypothetical protein